MQDTTSLVTVLGAPSVNIVGRYRQKRRKYELRDVSKLKRADYTGMDDEHGSDSESYTYDEETHTWRRKSKEMKTDEYDDYEFSDSERFSMGDDDFDGDGDGNGEGGGRVGRKFTVQDLCDAIYALEGETAEQRKERKMTMEFLTEFEKEEQAKWVAGVSSILNLPKELSKCQFLREMEVYSKRILKKLLRSGTAPWLRIVIIGPHGGGKTTFCAAFVKTLAETLGGLGAWRQTGFFSFDFLGMSKEAKTHIDLYKYIVCTTFDQLGKQFVKIKPYVKKMSEYFSGIADGKSARTFPKSIRVDKVVPYIDVQLTKLSKTIRKLVDDGDAPGLVRCAMNFPNTVAKLFNFRNVFLVCDHFEQADIDVIDARHKKFNIIEEVKTVLKVLPFIVCCQEEERLMGTLRALEDEGPDIHDKVTFVNIARIKLRKRHIRDDLLIHFARGYDPVRITREVCGGCVGFLAEWNAICKIATHASNFELRQGKLTRGHKCDDHAACIDKMRDFLPKVMDVSNLPPSSITGVKLVKGRL